MTSPLYNDLLLEKQAALQRDNSWDLDRDIDWSRGVDLGKYLLPLDRDAIAFPNLGASQRLALSQLLGLIINATIAEMEGVIDRLRDVAWDQLLRRFPVNPEMRDLGELFFEEEQKHAQAFCRYIDVFCASSGVQKQSLEMLLPKAFGSRFLKAIRLNASQGGFAFWWVVAGVEEVSVQIYQMMHKHQSSLDPLFFQIHRKHLEDEARHKNYAFLMLELAQSAPGSFKEKCLRKTDLVLAQVMTAGWVMAELHRIFEVENLKEEHPFFAEIASCLPALRSVPIWDLGRRLFVTAPYLSSVLNLRHHKQTLRFAQKNHVWRLPMPKPKAENLFTELSREC